MGLSGISCVGHDEGKEGALAWHTAKLRLAGLDRRLLLRVALPRCGRKTLLTVSGKLPISVPRDRLLLGGAA